MKVTIIVITKDRPRLVKELINSILEARLTSPSLVLIDDSDDDNFLQTKHFLQLRSISFIQVSSPQARKFVEKTLAKANLTSNGERFIKDCTGLNSPFSKHINKLFKRDESKSPKERKCLQFAPYSPARNLGICCAIKFFNPDIIFFLDDDCLILEPEKLESQLRLMKMQLNGKKIVAVAGIYKEITTFRQKGENQIVYKMVRILRGMDMFLRKTLMVEEKRFKIMPPHMLGGALVLSKKVFRILPFDPYVARGEDHAYALDLNSFLDRNEIAVRDNCFIVGHRREVSQTKANINVLRDIFRFIYVHIKTGCSFIAFLTFRWLLAALLQLFLNPSKYNQFKKELQALLFFAPKFAKENAHRFRQNTTAWKIFLDQLKT
jgi:glycosyltransferase involved in cell wall biosynthesis